MRTSLRSFGLQAQIQYAVMGLITCLYGVTEDHSAIYYGLASSGGWGYLTLLVLLVCSVLSLAEALLYQVLQLRWPSMQAVRRARHTFGLGIAFSWVAMAAQADSWFHVHGLLSIWAVLAMFLCISLITDALNERDARRRHVPGP